jgi:hypothetical protein
VPDSDWLTIERDGPVLAIRVVPLWVSLSKDVPVDIHRDLGLFLEGFRHDYDVRVKGPKTVNSRALPRRQATAGARARISADRRTPVVSGNLPGTHSHPSDND